MRLRPTPGEASVLSAGLGNCMSGSWRNKDEGPATVCIVESLFVGVNILITLSLNG